jgi:hypothetical protein
MKVSRREFVGTAGRAAAAASLCAIPSFGLTATDSGARAAVGCTLLDLESNCALPESLAGMEAALGDAHRRVTEIGRYGADSIVVVPAAGPAHAETFGAVVDSLERGSTVLWETGAAFLEPRDFAYQQDLAREHFGISMKQPVDVWSHSPSQRPRVRAKNLPRNMRSIGHAQIPYVVYRWPREAHVRDFSRVIPVSAASGRAIARWGEIPVAWRKRIGAGTLIFVGSPIGPALHAGDSDAASLLHSLIKA